MKQPHIHCKTCGKLIVAEKTHNGIAPCWLGHCCGFGQDACEGEEIYMDIGDELTECGLTEDY